MYYLRVTVQFILGYLNLDYLNAKISQATPTFTKATWVGTIVKSCKTVLSYRQSNMKCQKCIDYQREAGYMQAHGYG